MQISATQYANRLTSQATSQRDFSGVSGEDFMKILIKQLQLQDPFEPMTNQEMIAQMSTIRELEMNSRLTERLEQLTDQQKFASASGLIGKQVRGNVTDSAGNEYELEGVVTGVEFTSSGEALLRLENGLRLPVTSLTEVTLPQLEQETADESEDEAEVSSQTEESETAA